MGKKHTFIENIAEKLGLIPNLHVNRDQDLNRLTEPGDLTSYPPPEQWDDWVEYEATEHPKRVKKHYQIVPTTCFNCESACGLTAYIDKETNEIRKFEGNPYHPGSRGRNCAKGPATINQITDPDRILYPMKRKGERGAGEWERVSWDEVLDDIAGRIRKAIQEGRNNRSGLSRRSSRPRRLCQSRIARPGASMVTIRTPIFVLPERALDTIFGTAMTGHLLTTPMRNSSY
jgi:hypothetical protein